MDMVAPAKACLQMKVGIYRTQVHLSTSEPPDELAIERNTPVRSRPRRYYLGWQVASMGTSRVRQGMMPQGQGVTEERPFEEGLASNDQIKGATDGSGSA